MALTSRFSYRQRRFGQCHARCDRLGAVSLVGLEGVAITGMAFTLYGGHGWWDRSGVRHNSWRATKHYRFNG